MKSKSKTQNSFATRLRAFRVEAGLTAYALAKKSSVSKQTVSNLESGRIRFPSWDVACKLADALGVTLDNLRS